MHGAPEAARVAGVNEWNGIIGLARAAGFLAFNGDGVAVLRADGLFSVRGEGG